MSDHTHQSGDLVDGRYRLLDQIGSGGHGVVYRARREGIGRAVALKIISPEDAGSRDLDRLRREVFHASGLTHPNTIEVHDYGTTAQGDLYVAMEYLPGLDLCDWLAEFGAMDVPQTLEAILQVLDSLAEAHRLGIVHRDLKPENIIVQRPPGSGNELQLKLLDFGLSKYVGNQSSSVPATRLTQENRVYGTPQYMAPEQACGDEITPRTDIYTVGLITWEMLDGEPAFAGESRQEVMRRQIVEDLPELPATARGTALEGFIKKCTHKAAEDRFANAGRARQWLSGQKKEFDELRDLLGLSVEGRSREVVGEQAEDPTDTTPPVGDDGTLSATRLSQRIAELPLIGRDAEAETFLRWVDEIDGESGWLWLSGAPGTGKTRLLTELHQRLIEDGVRVFSARFRRTGSTVGTLAELLAPLLGLADESREERAVEQIPGVISPEMLGRMRRELGVGLEDDRRGETTSAGPMFPAVRQVLLEIARNERTILLLDGMHYAGGRATGFLQRLFTRGARRGSSLGICVAGRSQEMRANPPVAELLDRPLSDEPDEQAPIRHLELGALDEPVAERLLDHVLPLEPPLRESIVRHASGNPLYLAQLVRYLAERDVLVERDDQVVGLAEHDFGLDQLVPPSLRGLCLRRLKSLARDSRAGRAPIQLLARMAILGDRFEASLLEQMLEAEASPASDALAAALETLTDLDIVHRIELGGEPGFAFSDSVFRKAVLESLDEGSERSRKLHMLAARTKVRHLGVERRHRLPDRAHEVAGHLARAEEFDRAIDWYLRSASHFESVGDLSMAVDDLRAAERLVDRVDEEPSDERRRQKTDIRMKVAAVARRDGRFGPAEDTLRELLADTDRLDEPLLEAEISRQLGEVQLHQARFEKARSSFEQARHLFGEHGDDKRALRAAIGHANSFRYQGKNAEADHRFRSLLERARTLEATELEAHCRLSLGRSTYANGALPEAREHFETVFELVDEQSEVYGEALIDCGFVELFRAGTTAAIDRLRQALDHARRRGDLMSRARAHLSLGMALRRTSALAEAAEHATKAHALYERAAHRWGIAKAVLLQGEVAWSRGDAERAAQLAADARKLHRDLEDFHGLALSLTYEALFLNTTGHAEEARDLLMRALALESRSELELYRSRALLFLGMVEETENEIERAEMYYEEALGVARRQEHLEVELLAEVSLIKLELVGGPRDAIAERVQSIRRRSRSSGYLYPELFALTIEGLFAVQSGDDSRIDKIVARLEEGMKKRPGDEQGPDLKLPERLFRLAQMMARHRDSEATSGVLEAAETLMRRLGAEEFAHRLGLQRRTIADGDQVPGVE